MQSEAAYQVKLIKKLKQLFPGCFIEKNDPAQHQGVPDLLILFNDRWAMLETKRSPNAPKRPNQDHHVERFNGMSFAAIIHPGNEEQVLNDLQSTFNARREARIS